ncbi:Ig-like domain-containing protein [Treponema porcinum]|uniref:Ig-like domain (Group 3) n=1 Tax=Treponema porcinum TaxID=261392 RepID=A0A1T4N3V5_TREPO|nr:Ig-like domain-containing protein [Treponema porcinum]SJZ73796.1 Ig-like domain (group 3) [Treponema porcinum]
MNVTVYDKDGKIIEGNDTWTYTNVDTAGGMSITAARYFTKSGLSAAEQTLHNNYINIYGEGYTGDKIFTCTVELEDAAQEWVEPVYKTDLQPENIARGNVTTSLWLNDDIYEELMGANSAYQLEAGGIKKIWNGTDDEPAVLSILQDKRKDTAETKLAFSLNKKAEPTYSIGGYDMTGADFSGNSAAKNGKITFMANAGRNGIQVDPSTFTLYLFGPFEPASVDESFINGLYSKPAEKYNQYHKEQDSQAEILYSGADYKKGSVEAFTQTVTLPESITNGSRYIFAATGSDLDGLTLETSEGTFYGFTGIAAGTPPQVTISFPDDDAVIKSSEGLFITGTASSTESKIKEISYEITVYDYLKKDSGGNYIKVGTVTGFAEAVENTRFGDASVKYSCDVSKGTFVSADKDKYPSANPSAEYDNKKGQIFVYEIVVVVRDDSASESNEKRRIYLDNAKPVPLITNVDPVAEKQKDENGNIVEKKINGTVTISGKVTEKNLKSLVLTVKDSAEKTETHTYSEASFEEKIDTTLFSDGEVVFTLTAVDEAGNESSASEKYTVDQTTDKPVIKFSNGKSTVDGVDDFSKVVNGQNIFGVENNNKALFSFTDDDGLEEIKITLCDEYGAGISLEENNDFNVQIQDGRKIAENPVIYTPDGSASYSVSYILPQKEGKYILDIEVIDVECKNVGDRQDAETVMSYRKSTAKNYIVVSESNFVMKFADSKIVNDECEVKLEDTTVEGTISVTDLDKIKSIERYTIVQNESGVSEKKVLSFYKKDESGGITVSLPENSSKVRWTETISAGQLTEGENHFYYLAEDVTGNHSELELTCYADNTPPSVRRHSDTEKIVDKWLNSRTQTLTYIVQDAENNSYASGIDSVKYSFKNGESTTEGYFARGDSCDKNGNTKAETKGWILYKTTFDLPEGEATSVTVTVSDKVGNEKTDTPVFKIDTNTPTVTASFTDTSGRQVFQKTESISVAFDCTDVTSGIKKVELATNSNMQGAVSLTGDKIVSPYKYSLSGLSDGTHTIYVRATDNAGNKSEAVSTGEVIVDSTAPKVEIKTPVSGATVNKTISFAGMVTDNNLPDGSVPVLWYNDGTKWKDVSAVSTSLTNQEWTITGVDTTKLYNNDTENSGKTFDFRVVFTDKAGNKNASVENSPYKLTIDQNADRPEIKLTNINTTGSSISSNVVQGVISDDDGVSTKDGDYAKIKLYRIDSTKYNETTNLKPADGNDWKSIPVEAGTGIWKAEIDKDSEGEGSKHWYFYVIDEAGGEFCTKAASSLERPYLTDGSNEKTDNQTGVSFFFDTSAPTVKISLSEDGIHYSTTNTIFGGSKNLYVRAEVEEAVGMSKTAPAVLYIGGEKKELAASVPSNEEKKYIYKFNPIALSGYPADRPLSVSVTAEDSAGNTNKDILNITIDKDAPTVKIISPTTALSDAVSSSVSIKGIVQDDKSSIAKLEYVIPLTGETYSESDGIWNNMLVTSAAWELAFTSGSEESPDSLLYYVSAANLAVNKYAVNEIETGLGIYKVPVYFRTTDSVGNVAVDKTQFVYADPNGGKPKAWINAPEQGTVTSGTVTIYGGASDNVSVSKVCVQIDVNGDGIITEEDYNLINANPEEYIGEYVNGMLVASTAVGNDWYILAGGTSSWKCPIVTDSIAKYTGTTGTEIGTQTVTNGKKYFVSRVRAIDGDNLTRSYTDYHCITIDDTAPWFTDLAVVQYGSGVTPDVNSIPIVEREYISGMYISNNSVEANGKWYLTGYVKSNTEINSIEANSLSSTGTVVIDLPEISKGVHTVQDTNESGTKDVYKLLIPLATDSSGMIYSELKSTNGVGTGNQTVKINIDSTAPSLYTTAGAESTTGTDALRLKSLSKMVGIDLSANSVIENSDGYFTFGDNVIEAGSGLQFIAFYLQNEIGNKVYDPMHSASGTAISGTKTENALYINSDNLAAFYVTGATRSTPYSLTHSSVDSTHVRVGGLVKIGGSYHTITDVAGTTVTFTPAASTTFVNAELIYAQVVDHQITEYFDTAYDSNDDAYYTLMNDDGDQMCETITQIGTTYQWTASVDSTNIPDGKTYIRVVAMDNAGNLSYGKIKSIVANNRPRMTKVFIGTDLNSSGNYDFDADEAPVVSTNSRYRTPNGTCYGEFNYYTAYNTRTGLGQSAVTLASNTFKVVKGLCIIPEFVGGNGSLKYILDKDDITTTANNTGTLTAMKNKDNLNVRQVGSIPMFGTVTRENPDGNTNPVAYGGTDIGGTTYYDFGGVEISQSDLSGVTSVKLTFWDETDSTSGPSTNGQWATLVIPFSNMGEETNPPVPVIKPFYWNGSGDNSVLIKEAGDSSASIKGHIELEGALPDDSAYTSGLPKVSGKIKIEGTVTDNVLVKSISMNVFGSSKTVATYLTGMWSQCDDLPTGVVSFTAEDKELSQNGHTVSYVAVIDTEKLNESGYPVGTNKTITISAIDWNKNTSTPGNTQTESSALTDCYKMDVVPYVTEIVTHLSSFYGTAPSVYARTALGHYPVYEGETIQFVGYNLGSGKAKVVIPGMEAAGTVLSDSNSVTLTSTSAGKTGARSGVISVSVNNIPALNNLNVNDAKGSYSGSVSDDGYANAYNRQPNGVNNNVLTDDLAIDVWQFKDAAKPVNGGAERVTMKINPVNGTPGFSYANSVLYFSMPGYSSDNNTNTDSYGCDNDTINGTYTSQIPFGMNYGGFSHNSFTFDNQGYSYGAAMCTDTQSAKASAFFQFFSKETPILFNHYDQNMNYCNEANASRLDSSTMNVGTDSSQNWQCNINRIQSISMETSNSNGTSAATNLSPVYVFMAYYDAIVKQVRFRWGTVGAYSDSIDGKKNKSSNEFDSRKDNCYGLDDIHKSEYTGYAEAKKYDGQTRPSSLADSFVKYSNTNNNGLPIQVIAGSGLSYSGTHNSIYAKKDYTAGQYVSLSILGKDTASPTAVVFWYDGSKLMMAYNTSPTTTKTWVYKTVDTDGGLHVKSCVDSDGGIHLAYYTANGGNLKYAYLSSVTETPQIATVDANGAVGTKCTIDVAKVGGNQVPYITYQMIGGVYTYNAKIAYRTNFDSTVPAGADSKDMFTGDWEVSVIPTQSTSLLNDDTINVGVWRDSSGNAKAFTSNDYWKANDKWFAGTDSATLGTVGGEDAANGVSNGTMDVGNPSLIYGNNTANPIVGYGVESGAIEMAQKK